jgi:excinuclease UvrABC nuclease subunit
VVYDISDAKTGRGYCRQFILWPAQWAKLPAGLLPTWRSLKYDSSNFHLLPSQPGVYAFVLKPGVANLDLAYLLYVGKAANQTLSQRCPQYLAELRARKPRMEILDMFLSWGAFLHLCFTPTADGTQATALERQLLEAWTPPMNKDLPAGLSAVVENIYRG